MNTFKMANKTAMKEFKIKCEIQKKLNILDSHEKIDSFFKSIPSLGTISVRRSMRISKQKPIDYKIIVDEEKLKKETTERRDLLNMEISPIRQMKNLTIEARHTLSLEESKKKRQQFENSLFLPNNKKRKAVLNIFNRKSTTKSNQKHKVPNSNFVSFNPKELNKQPVRKQSSNNIDPLLQTSEKSDKSSLMKLNHSNEPEVQKSEEKVKDGKVEKKKISSKKSTEKNPFPSYVSFRTKGNKIKLVQNKSGQEFSKPTSTSDLDEQPSQQMDSTTNIEEDNKESSIFTTEKSEPSSSKPKRSESPSNSDENSAEIKAEKEETVELIEESIERPSQSTQSSLENDEASSQSTIISNNYPKCKKVQARSVPTPTINSSSGLLTNYSNSREFLMQSAESSEYTSFSSECLETSSVDPPKLIKNTPKKIKDLLKVDKPTEPKKVEILRARSPEPFGYIIRSEVLPIKFSARIPPLIQDAYVHSSTTAAAAPPSQSNNHKPLDMSKLEEARGSVSQQSATTESSEALLVEENNGSVPSASTANALSHQSRSSREALNLRTRTPEMPNFTRYFAEISQQRSAAGTSETSAQTDIFRWTAKQHLRQKLMTHGIQELPKLNLPAPNVEINPQQNCIQVSNRKEASQSRSDLKSYLEAQSTASFRSPSAEQQRHGFVGYQTPANSTESKNPIDQIEIQATPRMGYSPRHEPINQGTPTATARAEFPPRTRLQDRPNCNRYFEPFFLSPVIGADATPSTSSCSWNREFDEQQRPKEVGTNELNLKEPLQPMPVATNNTHLGLPPQPVQLATTEQHIRAPPQYIQNVPNRTQVIQSPQPMQVATDGQHPSEPPQSMRIATNDTHLRESPQPMQVSTIEQQSTQNASNCIQEMEPPQPIQAATNEMHPRRPLTLPPSSFQEIVANINRQHYPIIPAIDPHGSNPQHPHPNVYNNPTCSVPDPVTNHTQAPAASKPKRNYTRKAKTNQAAATETSSSETHSSTAPNFNNQPFYRPPFSPAPSYINNFNSRNQHRFNPYPAIHQQNNYPTNYPYASNFHHPQPQTMAHPNTYASPQRHASANIHDGNCHQPCCQGGTQNHQYSFANQTAIEQVSYDSRNFHAPNPVNNDNNVMRYHLNNQNSYWGPHNQPSVEPSRIHHQTSTEQRPPVDANTWLNDRLQNVLQTNGMNESSPSQERSQGFNGSSKPGPVSMDTWMRARTEQAARPPPPSYKQRMIERDIDAVMSRFRDFMTNLSTFNQPQLPPPPVASQTAHTHQQTWQQMTNNVPTMGNNAMQSVQNSGMAWEQYSQMDGNRGYPRNNASSEHSTMMERNYVNQQRPTQQMYSHQINAADSTTGGSSNSCLRSYRQNQNQYNNEPLNPYAPSEHYNNPYLYFNNSH